MRSKGDPETHTFTASPRTSYGYAFHSVQDELTSYIMTVCGPPYPPTDYTRCIAKEGPRGWNLTD